MQKTLLIKTATDENVLKQIKWLLISYNFVIFWGDGKMQSEKTERQVSTWVENWFVKGGNSTWKLKVKCTKMIVSLPACRANTAAAWWWIYQQIFVHFLNFTAVPGCTWLLSAIYLPPRSVTRLPDEPGQFIITLFLKKKVIQTI